MESRSSRCPYAVLNLPIDSDDDDIKDAYKHLSRLLHPDKRRPGKERDAAQEAFIELTNAYEIIGNNTLRQAYDHFGHSGVSIVRHNLHQADSLFNHLSKLHEDGKPLEALRMLHSVLEDTELKKQQKQLEFNADINVDLHLCDVTEASGISRLEVKSTNVSVSAAVPMPRQTNASSPFAKEDAAQERKQKMKLSIGGQSDLENGLASSKSVFAATYKPRPETDVVSQLVFDRKHMETTLSSTHLLSSGTMMSAKMTRSYNWEESKAGKLSFGFTSNRVLSIFQGRTVHASFSFGVGSNLKMNYGILSLVTWGFNTTDSVDEDEEDASPQGDDDNDEEGQKDEGSDGTNTEKSQNNQNSTRGKLPPPRLSAKLVAGSHFPFEMSISQDELFHSPGRSGDATLSWSPLLGFRIKGMLNREISTNYITCDQLESQSSGSLSIGLDHTPMSGLKWLISYERPEGISIQVPIFVSRILSPNYMNDLIWYGALSFLVDELVGEVSHTQTPTDSSIPIKQEIILDHKVSAIQGEQRWLHSSKAMINAEKQVRIMRPIAASKRKREAECNGLVIIKAMYYRQSADLIDPVNVTDQLQFFVHNSALVLPASSKSLLLGFSHVDHQTIGQPESNRSYANKGKALFSWLLNDGGKDEPATSILSVRYKFKGNVFETSVRDNDSLHLPNKNDLNLGASNLVS